MLAPIQHGWGFCAFGLLGNLGPEGLLCDLQGGAGEIPISEGFAGMACPLQDCPPHWTINGAFEVQQRYRQMCRGEAEGRTGRRL